MLHGLYAALQLKDVVNCPVFIVDNMSNEQFPKHLQMIPKPPKLKFQVPKRILFFCNLIHVCFSFHLFHLHVYHTNVLWICSIKSQSKNKDNKDNTHFNFLIMITSITFTVKCTIGLSPNINA